MTAAEDIIRDMRKRCRLAMNGVTSSDMRKYGLDYKLNFGVSLPQIKEIAKNYTLDKEIAQNIWTENVRELKILATLLYPPEEFGKEKADEWVRQIPNQEIREQACLNLFQQLYYAKELAEEWANDNDENIRTTGYWLLSRLLISKKLEKVELSKFRYIFKDLSGDNVSLRNAALIGLKQAGRTSKEAAAQIINNISDLKSSDNPQRQEMYNSLEFEFEFYLNK